MRRGTNPPLAIQSQTTTGHNAVQMVVIEQGLTPGVQDRGDANACLQAMFAKLQQRSARGIEQNFENNTAILSNETVEQVWHREDDVKIRDREQGCLLLFQPLRGQRSLTLWTVAVATTMRDEVFTLAGSADKELATERAGPTRGQGAHGFPLVWRQAQFGRASSNHVAQHLPHARTAHSSSKSYPRREKSSNCNGPPIIASRSCRT